MCFPRLKYTPYALWFATGSVCYCLFLDGQPIAFSWIHHGSHWVDKVGTFRLGVDTKYIGPMFVHKKCRGIGLQKYLYQICMNEIGTCKYVTCINEHNTPSVRNTLASGFHKAGEAIYYRGSIQFDLTEKLEIR